MEEEWRGGEVERWRGGEVGGGGGYLDGGCDVPWTTVAATMSITPINQSGVDVCVGSWPKRRKMVDPSEVATPVLRKPAPGKGMWLGVRAPVVGSTVRMSSCGEIVDKVEWHVTRSTPPTSFATNQVHLE
jgi:hypothetical protein